MHRLATLLAALALAACRTGGAARPLGGAAEAGRVERLVDAHATAETRALFVNLRRLAGRRVLFGHQDDLAYGHDWVGEPGRSDVKDVAGVYPALYGWELSNLERGLPNDLNGVDFARMREWIVDAYRRGGVVTLTWHMSNPTTGGSAWDTTAALATLLPGGANHARYVAWLDRFADFALALRASAPRGGTVLVPLIFRPFHEMSGGWFWWGATHASPGDFQRLWRFTVEYLRDRRGVHNLLWAYAPNALFDYGASRYFTWYPGDGYVDVLGVDQYWQPPGTTWVPADQAGALADALRFVVHAADARGKLAALTETGYETIPDSTWWTHALLAAVGRDSLTRRIAYVMTWRNGNRARMRREHYFAPFPGQASARDFVRFRADPLVAFEDDLPALYSLP
jgi:mannan endo-1,4-beta-mannosidase